MPKLPSPDGACQLDHTRGWLGYRRWVAEVKAELVGNLWKIVAEVGQQVDEDDTIMILESMKMEIPIVSPVTGTVREILVAEGEVVQEGQTVAVVG